MKYSFTKVLILRPQARLLLLINNQIPDFNWRLATSKYQDLTAYLLPYFKNDVDMLSVLELNFLRIFQNELRKIIGLKNIEKLSLTFFDFLICFKFEWHDEAKFVYRNFSKKVCISQKNLVISVNLKKIKTIGDLCDVLYVANANLQIIPIKDLTVENFWRQMTVKIQFAAYKIKQQVKHSCHWHWLSHARDPRF